MVALNGVYVAGVAQTKFGKDFRELEEILIEAAENAYISSGRITPDVVVVGNYNSAGYSDKASLDALVGEDLRKKKIIKSTTPVFRVDRGSASGAAAVESGFIYAQSGNKVLVLSGEKMLTQEVDRERITRETSKVISIGDRKLHVTMPILAAIATTEYMAKHNISKEQVQDIFFQILNQDRKYGALNPGAYFKSQVLKEDYFDLNKNPWIAEPLTRNDCAGTYNGAAAVFLVPYETDIKLSGIASAFSCVEVSERHTLISLDATVDAARKVFQDTELNPHEIDIVELHDAFQSIPILAAEDIGFVERGKGSEFILKEENKHGKKIFYNRSGGFLSKSHPVGTSGAAQLVELVSQMRGLNQYSEMFEKDLNYGLWFSVHGFGFYNDVGIIEKTTSSVKREGFNEENLQKRVEPQKKFFPKIRSSELVGMTTSPLKDYDGLGVIRTPNGKLELGYIENTLDLGSKLKLGKSEIPSFVPISNLLLRILVKTGL